MANPLAAYGYSDRQYADLVGTLIGEGLGQGVKGYAGIADVIANRRQDPQAYAARSANVSDIVKAPGQFDAWNGRSPRTRGGFQNAKAGWAAAHNPKVAEKLGLTDEIEKVNEALVGVFGNGKLAGVTRGATFYQNDEVTSAWGTGGFQSRLADRQGNVRIGDHVFTGPDFRRGQPFDPVNLGIPNPIPDLPGPLPAALNPEIPTPNVPDVPFLAGWGFPADLGQVPDVPAPFDEGVPVARGQLAGNALFDAITDARIGSPIEVPEIPSLSGWGYPDPTALPDVPYAPANMMAPGQIEVGNIDLNNRPTVVNDDGTISTVRSMSINVDDREVLVPTVSDDGRLLSDEEAIQQFAETGRHLGTFTTPQAATDYAERLHEDQERQYVGTVERDREREREQRIEKMIDATVQANMPPDVGAPSIPGPPDVSSFGFGRGATATNPGALPALGVDMPERQMEAAIRDQRIKDLEEGRFAKGFGTLGPDIEKMNRDLMAELSAPAPTAAPVDLAPEVSVAPAIARATPSATVGAPATPQAAPTPRAAAAPAPARPTPAPALAAPVEIREAPRVFSGPPPADLPTAGTYPNPAKAPGLGFGSGTFGLPEGVLPGALVGGLFGGPVGALLGGLGGWGLGSLFGNDGPAYGTPGAMGPYGKEFDDLGISMPHDRHMGSLAEAQAFADSQGGWGGFGGLGDVFGGFGGRNEFGGIVDSGFGLGPESFDNPRDPTGSDYRG